MTRAAIGLGGNLGDGPALFASAAQALTGLGRVVAASGLYRSQPLGMAAGTPTFLNAAVVLETDLPPEALLAGLLAIERAHGRERPAGGEPSAPQSRTLDLDLLLMGRESRQGRFLNLPHPALAGRAFALLPLLEVDPDCRLPSGRPLTAAGLVDRAERVAGPAWAAPALAPPSGEPPWAVGEDLRRPVPLEAPPVYRFGRITSTTDVLRQLEAMGAPDGTAVVAEEQTAGRGRHGRRWEAARGSALLTSILLRGVEAVGSLLPLLVGVAAVEAVRAAGGPELRLKWPNDLLWQERKAGGILVERLRGDAALVGVGMNVRRLARDRLAPAQEHVAFLSSSRRLSRGLLLDQLRRAIDRERQGLVHGGGGSLIDRWAQRSDLLGRRITVHVPDGSSWTGEALRLGPDGALWVRAEDGTERPVHAGEVSVRLDSQRELPRWVQPPA